ncbi:receptor-type tyrosine-protein phosphatase mu [Patella vulgata]|uniref:receptor-type tyrosine-protein phosphatase mu n=1 Tax=Patella vulgata TaxID=6465 RepID=UPI0021808D56|nr:receptor-type tyrosine-protein phosphatase mu [Patella vulgata]
MRLIWDVKTGKIVMVTNSQELGVVKCLEYWPMNGKTKSFKKISVKVLAEDIFAHFTIRTLEITKEGWEPRTIIQYHYTSWPDKGVPADAASLVEFRNKVNKSPTPHPGPMIVHCSAGIGRTGTFLALDYLIEEGKAGDSVDVVRCVSRMRTERVNMIQTLDQYIFLHEGILEWYIAGNITTSIADYKTIYKDLLKMQTSGKCLLEQKFEMMKKVSPVHTKDDCYSALLDENKNKNRNRAILASESVRPFISAIDSGTDYINAVYIPSYRKKQAYILTQTPLPDTVIDFWRMVIQTESYIIVDLDHGQEISRDIGQYLPETKLMCGDFSITKSSDTQNKDDYSIVGYKIGSDIDVNVNQTVKVYECKFWNDQQQTPESFISLINVLEHVKSSYENSNPLVVVCRDGVTKGGIFCVLTAILERLTIEQDVSVLQTIVQLRASRPQIITSYEQLKFCFDAIQLYLENYTTYVNIL